ncbi:hypothetical protein [Brevibacillus panacihumi]|uniref:Uncharacterized protein n=1 Tax=Brevibacillus panacihumi TaxID=497735 RepID=A0A3M8DC23_9BACL|nr:hypothetical protein [Brevibacillus panacihumi]RNB85513.1 hypothetical protein EDM58_03005 [Brevibacillus panacihumi]
MKYLVVWLAISLSLFGVSSSHEENPAGADAAIQEQARNIPLQFEPAVNENEKITFVQGQDKGEIIERRKSADGEFFIYKIPNDPYEELYGGLRIGEKHYHFGQIGYGKDTSAITIASVEAMGRKLLKVNGFRGANYRVTYYIQVQNQVPSVFLFVDGGAHYEGNMDGDPVIIGSYAASTSFQTILYRMEGEKLVFADLNKQLHEADSVRVTDDLLFEVRQKADSVPRLYTYQNKTLIPLNRTAPVSE